MQWPIHKTHKGGKEILLGWEQRFVGERHLQCKQKLAVQNRLKPCRKEQRSDKAARQYSDSVEHRCVGTFIFSYEGASGGEKWNGIETQKYWRRRHHPAAVAYLFAENLLHIYFLKIHCLFISRKFIAYLFAEDLLYILLLNFIAYWFAGNLCTVNRFV